MSQTCDTCRLPTPQIVHCDCFSQFCPQCFQSHHCGREASAQWSRAPEPEPVKLNPQILTKALGAMPPRDYQLTCSASVFDAFRESRRTLVVMPTGTGKTVLFGHVSANWESGRVLILAHRDELIRQAADKVGRIVGEQCDIEMGEAYADQFSFQARSHVVVSSVQTMCRERRHSRFSPDDFGLLVIDEAHHAVADSYRTVIDYFSRNPNLKVLGVTATPDRADEEALGKVFDSVAFDYQITDAIRDGWLVPIEQQFVYVDGLDFSNVRTMAGDLNGGDLAKIMEAEEMLHKVVDPTIQLAGDQQTLVFASSVAHAERMAEICNRHRSGCAEFIAGTTELETRRDILKRYSRGDFQFLFNCAIATEGFDEPTIGVVAIARPTKSRALYSQMIGRGTRTLTGTVDGLTEAAQRRAAIAGSNKQSVLILDFVGNSGRHKLVSTADILGGNYDDDVVERAKSEASKKSAKGERVDMTEELIAAQERIKSEEARKRSQLIGKAKFGTKSVNPFDIFDIAPRREPGWHKGRKPSDKMLSALRKFKVDEKQLAELSFSQAGQLLDTLCKRAGEGKCTLKQAQILSRNGERTDVSFEEASRLIDAIAKNGWKPLAAAVSH